MSIFGAGMDTGPRSDRNLSMGLMQLLRMAWADPDLRSRILFVLFLFGVFVLGVHIPVPIHGFREEEIAKLLEKSDFLNLISMFGGGAIRRLSIFSLGLNPYITASIIMQVVTQAYPSLKKEMQEGGEYARRKQNRYTRMLTMLLCIVQGASFYNMIASGLPAQASAWAAEYTKISVIVFWTAGAMFMLWLGEQITEKGIGNGVSLMIFAGIIVAAPQQVSQVTDALQKGVLQWYMALLLVAIFLICTWVVVYFTIAQRRIPIQHMRRNVGTRVMGGATSYLPINVSTAGVIPIIFAVSLLFMPAQFAGMTPPTWLLHDMFVKMATWLDPLGANGKWIVGCLAYVFLIFGFSYFYTAIQYNVEDMADNLKRAGSFIPGVRPGRQTKEFLDSVISRVTIVGACFLAVVALAQYVAPAMTGLHRISIIGGTTLLIVVQVALDTMRQIEANILMRQYEA